MAIGSSSKMIYNNTEGSVGPVGNARRDIGAIREELARLLKDYDDIYDYHLKRNYELHESIPTEAGRKVPC